MVKLPLSNTPCGQKPSHMAKQMRAFILKSPQKALDLLHCSLTELPPQAMIVFSDKDLILQIILWSTGELNDLFVMCKDQDIDVRDDDSDESVGQPWKKKSGNLT